jgi:CubicO group peptidase (beta-lactamase class C family)
LFKQINLTLTFKYFKMGRRYSFLVFVLILIGFSIFTSSCKKDEKQICANVWNIDIFKDNMKQTFDANVMGYAYIITKKGQTVFSEKGGLGRNATDGQKDMSVNQRMQMASVSKTLTTVTTLAVLDFKNVSVNSSVAPYLPPHWIRGPGIQNLTFFDLLSQQSGLNQFGTQNFSATRYDSLQAYIVAGATGPKVKRYSNTNHGLMRVILPRLWDKARPVTGLYDEDFTTKVYQDCVKEFVFDPLGINGVTAIPPANNPNLAYASANDNGNGRGGTTDFSNVLGGTGWNMSTIQLAKFFSFLWYSEDIISSQDLQWMKDNTAGFWNTTNGKYGTYYCKLGSWGYGGGTAINTIVIQFPNDVAAILMVNSPHPSGSSLRTLVVNAYDSAEGC